MKRSLRWPVAAIVTLFLLAIVGCGKSTSTPTAIEYFKTHQAKTTTPYGRIVLDSVEEKAGKIQYRTEDGKTWRTGYSKLADGTYQYGPLEEIKSAS